MKREMVRKGRMAILAGGILLLFSVVLRAECKIQINSDPSLPGKNLIRNPDFEEEIKPKDWTYYRSKSDWSEKLGVNQEDGVTLKEKHSGKCSYKFVGEKGVNKGIRQDSIVEFDPPIPAGTPIVISVFSKAKGTTSEGDKPSLSCNVTYSDGTNSYFPAPSFPQTSYDWMRVTTRGICKKDVKNIYHLYLCYYNQEGEIYFDNLFLGIGKTKLSYSIEAPDIKSIKLYSEEKGLIKDSGILPSGTNTYSYTEEVDILDNYCVEVEDRAGNKFLKRYPEIALLKEKAKGISIFKRFNQELIKPTEEGTYAVTLPKIEGKEVILELKARLHSERLAGYNPGLKILFNNTEFKLERLINRKATFIRANGTVNNTYYNSGFTTYFSPNFAPIPEDNVYYPVDIPNHDPYLFKFKVTDLVKEGVNSITIKNNYTNFLILEDARIIFE